MSRLEEKIENFNTLSRMGFQSKLDRPFAKYISKKSKEMDINADLKFQQKENFLYERYSKFAEEHSDIEVGVVESYDDEGNHVEVTYTECGPIIKAQSRYITDSRYLEYQGYIKTTDESGVPNYKYAKVHQNEEGVSGIVSENGIYVSLSSQNPEEADFATNIMHKFNSQIQGATPIMDESFAQ